MFAKLTALVGGGYSFPYNVEEAFPSAWGQWTHHTGTSREDGSAVSVFKLTAADPNDRRLNLARNGVKRLKMLRHPSVLAFKDSAEVQEKGQTVVYLVTQPVKPLKVVLDELDLSGQHRDEYLAMGLLHMTNVVSFLNNDCKLIHGNICMDSIVVTDTLDWKLHGFDLLSELSLPPDNCLVHASWMVGNQYKAPELGKSEWAAIREGPPWAVDAWGLGCLMQEAFSREPLASVEGLRRTASIPPALLGDYQKLLSSNASRRLNPAKVAESKFLNNRLVEVVAFMENISVKDSSDKDTFFKRLGSALPAIPAAVATKKILPLLAHALEFGGAPPSAVGPLLSIGNALPSEDFNKRVVPILAKLFASPDRGLRRSLLEGIDGYSQHLTTAVLEDQIFPSLQTGFTDGNAYIRELTLKSVMSLAPKLSNKTLVGNVLKHLSRLQVDEEPSIRANTTVLLGNIAPHLGEATCKRVLLNAFTRALKDAFPPARIAGLRAMVATQRYYTAEDAALRILPSTAPLALDALSEVRAAALQVLDLYIKALQEDHSRRTANEAAALATGDAVASTVLGATGGAPNLAAGSSMLTWAVSSLMSSTGLAVKPGPPPPPDAAAAAPGPGSSYRAPDAKEQPRPGPPARPGAAAVSAPQQQQLQQQHTATNSAAAGGRGDGWAAGDGWDDEDIEVDDAEQKARARLSALAGSSRPAARPSMAAGRGAGVTGSPAAARPGRSSRASSGGGGGDGWEAAVDDGGWDGMETAAPAPVAAVPAARPAARSRLAATESSGASTAGAVKPRHGGAMKLGVQKLGVTKASSTSNLNFDTDNW